MKQIVDKLNKIAKKINENVELSDRDLIIDSLDSITKAYGGTPNDSNLIVDKLEDIYNNIGSAPSGNIEITENGENINVAPYATATVNVSGGGGDNVLYCAVNLVPNAESLIHVDNAFVIENQAINSIFGEFDSETELICPYFMLPSDDPQTPPLYILRLDFVLGTLLSATNAVNCSYVDGGILITDRTIPSSITLSGYTPK